MGHGKNRVIDDKKKNSEQPSLKHISQKLAFIAKQKRAI
jgi:hypothetical protein